MLSAMQDSRGRSSLGDLVSVPERLYPVGRLDITSEGLILLTDDGELANLLTHPSHGHEKEYRVLVNGLPTEETLAAWRRGVMLEGERTAPAEVDVIRKEKDSALLRIVMHEGRKRQIRNVASLLGHPVRELVRVRLGPLRLGAMRPGQWRHLTDDEYAELMALKTPGKPKQRRRVRSATPAPKPTLRPSPRRGGTRETPPPRTRTPRTKRSRG
jgi:23S rRNA pseudouridine2605 synthase